MRFWIRNTQPVVDFINSVDPKTCIFPTFFSKTGMYFPVDGMLYSVVIIFSIIGTQNNLIVHEFLELMENQLLS